MANVTLAYQTMAAIDSAIKADQGASYRGWLGRVLPHIGDAYRTEEDGHRSHMGASMIGGECGRAIWYNFHWATKPSFEGRILRLFNRGHLEEGRFIAMLLMIGVQVYQQDENGKQFRISHAEGHYGGSGDGKLLGVPELKGIDQEVLAEFKTHGDSSFVELAGKAKDWRKHLEDPVRNPFTGKGLRAAKFEHYVQMQQYMRKMGIAVGLYMAVNKNTDDVYAELIVIDTELADQFLDRATKLVWSDTAPARLSNSPGFFKCVFCDHKPVCHLKSAPDFNCRTCQHSRPADEGLWYCGKHKSPLVKEAQLKGCSDWIKDPEL